MAGYEGYIIVFLIGVVVGMLMNRTRHDHHVY
jgi:hypothetical protein